MKESITFIVIVGAIALANIFWVEKKYPAEEAKPSPYSRIEYVNIAGRAVKVELAETLEEQSLGLSGRYDLPEGEGMLFIFKTSGEHPFWMKEMNFPIDIIWIAEDGRVVYIKDSATPESFPEVYKPNEVAKYVLEVRAGFATENNLKVGDGVEFAY
jgi:hypothetical protein